jgi:PIN domain nuclease of toxin-antitoxin system
VSLLLDTHVWLWALTEPERLSPAARRALRGSELWLSPISTWELLLLVERGRVELEGDVDEWLEDARARAPTREAPVTHEIARASRRIEVAHDDPADRFLAATAQVLELTLVTADQRLLAGKGYSVLAAAPPPDRPAR